MMFLVLLIVLPILFALSAASQKRKARLQSDQLAKALAEAKQRHAQAAAEAQKRAEEYRIQILNEKRRQDEADERIIETLKNLPPTGAYSFDRRLRGSFVNRGRSIPLAIQYASGAGEISYRKISMRELKATIHQDRTITPILVTAFCHLRNEERTFYLDSIRAAIDPETGLVIDDIATHVCQAFDRYRPVRRYSG